ncbi:MAG: PLP-dependent aminotransferase family protein [Pseudomonadota bacterium]|nr:PLP-dependent aminotransferase family protein [Pseudomonadota bacterium]
MTRSAYFPELPPPAKAPVFLQLAHAIAEDVRRGRLRPGERLPGSRALAERLGVHRNTVLASLQELEAQGWVRAEPARGVFVAVDLPRAPQVASPRATPSASGAPMGFTLPAPPPALPPEVSATGALWMSGGQPDLRILPLPELARAYRRALSSTRLLNYGDPRGEPRLRAALAQWLGDTRGLATTAEDLVVTRGSQQALALLAQVLLRPGDTVAVEAYGYPQGWAALRAAGATLLPVPVDAEGLDVAALEAMLDARSGHPPIKAVYLTPHHQYPTGAVLSPARREALLALAARHQLAVLEDDYDNEFHYRGRPLLPLASADRHGVVAYIGTLSKAFAPGLRLGFVRGPRPLLDRLADARRIADRQGDRVVEIAIAELLEDGTVVRHVRKSQQIYRVRRDVLLTELRALDPWLRVDPPPGGMALWCHVDPALSADTWARAALAEGVVVHAGSGYSFDGAPLPFLRLGFACLDEAELREAMRRLTRARPRP